MDRPAVEDTDSIQRQSELDAAQETVPNETSDFKTGLPTYNVTDVDVVEVNKSATATETTEACDTVRDEAQDIIEKEKSKSDTGTFISLQTLNDTERVADTDNSEVDVVEVNKSVTATEKKYARDTVRDEGISIKLEETNLIHSTKPSQPKCLEVGSDFILLYWASPQSEDAEYFEVKYKVTRDRMWNKKSIVTKDNSPQIYVRGLLQATGYTFKVRAQYMDDEGEFNEPSDSIHTIQSPALSVRDLCMKLQDGEPAFYKLPLGTNPQAKNAKFKTRKCEFGSSHHLQKLQEKTIIMIGATGSGKSTLIDGMVNHLLGVKWEDDFRFKIIDLMADEEARKGLQTESQTEWITSYKVHPINKTVQFICNIIDTPGFGDTRGIQRDQQLVSQIRAFFDTKGVQGIESIDAICFVTQAPLARLTQSQRYIYESILSIFGKDMQDNIVAMITFADGKEPPVVNALMQAEVPIKTHFMFNNSALFEPNTEGQCNEFGKMFWDMGSLSYGRFFDSLPRMKTQSLQLTAEVLLKREQLNVTIAGLLPQIDIGLGHLETMRQERDPFYKVSREIHDNQNFTYEVDEFYQEKVMLAPGEYATNCTFCNYTCHFPCGIPDDKDKSACAAMANGICTVCPTKCQWNLHRNNDFLYKSYTSESQENF